jgi:hypothetical protein
MPRFYDEENPALNSFRKVNAEVVRRRKKKYAEQPQAQAPVSGSPAQFDDLRQRLVAIDVGMSDLNQTINLSSASTTPSTVIDRFVSTASNLSGQVSNTRDFVVRKLKRNLNSFSGDEVAEINGLVQSLQQKLSSSLATLQDRIANPRGQNWRARELFNQNVLGVLQTFTTGLTELIQIIGDAVASYKQSGVGAGRKRVLKCGGQSQTHVLEKYLSTHPQINALPFPRLNDQLITPLYQPIRKPIGLPNPFHTMPELPDARFFRKIGGAELYSHEPVMKGGQGVASRRGLQFGNPFTKLGPFPPRNTQDLKDLPRRFL